MSWREQLLPASFRGVPFFVESADLSAGRRAVHHEIPFSEEPPFSQDMGARTKTFPLEGYVLGDDYFTARDNLLAALNTAGPGELVHPYLGLKRVQVGGVRVRHESRAGGICRFSIEFTETSAPLALPVSSNDAPAQLAVSAAALKTAGLATFTAEFDPLANLRGAVTDAVAAVTGQVGEVLDRAAIAGDLVAAMRSEIATLDATAAQLLATPSALGGAVLGLVEQLAEGLQRAGAPLTALLELFSTDLGNRPPDDTPAQRAERANFDAVGNLLKRAVLAEASLMAVNTVFVTYEEAVSARDGITDLLDQHTDEVADDAFPSLQDLRRDLVEAVPGEDSDLPRLVNYTPHSTLPSLVLAHVLYGDLDREQDIIDRNRIANPGFVTGGVELQVLSDD